mgnify:CR=1 FL=1
MYNNYSFITEEKGDVYQTSYYRADQFESYIVVPIATPTPTLTPYFPYLGKDYTPTPTATPTVIPTSTPTAGPPELPPSPTPTHTPTPTPTPTRVPGFEVILALAGMIATIYLLRAGRKKE